MRKNIQEFIANFPTKGLPDSMTILRGEVTKDMDRRERNALLIQWRDKREHGGMLRLAWFALSEDGSEWEYLGDKIIRQ